MSDKSLDRWLNGFSGWGDIEASREIVLACGLLAAFLATAARGRRWLARGPAVLLAGALVPLAVSFLFRESADAVRATHLVMRFFVLASLLQSLVLVFAVSGWEWITRRSLPTIVLDVFRWAVVAFSLLVVLWEAGVDAGQLFTGSAVFTAALGFALKDTLGNVFAGLAIQAESPFEVGDWIQYDANPAHVGRVVEVNWRATKVITLDEAYVIVPNGQLAQASIRNFTKPDPWSRRSLYVVTPYGVSPQKVQQVILECLRGSFGVLEHPPASVVTNAFTERGIEHWIRFFTTEFDKRDRVDGAARDRIYFALARHGIEIPVSTQHVRLVALPPPPPPESPEAAASRRIASLARVGLLQSLDAAQMRQLASRVASKTFAAGEQVIRQGDPGSSMYVIDSGRVQVSLESPETPPKPLADLGPGDFFGEMSLMTGEARSATVTAVEESLLVEVDKEAFRSVLEQAPGLVAPLGQYLAARAAERSRVQEDAAIRQPAEKQDMFQRILEFFAMAGPS